MLDEAVQAENENSPGGAEVRTDPSHGRSWCVYTQRAGPSPRDRFQPTCLGATSSWVEARLEPTTPTVFPDRDLPPASS